MGSYLFQDWSANRGNIKGRIITSAFRLAYFVRQMKFPIWLIGIPILVSYRICVEWILGVELPFKTKVGRGLIIQHGQGLVINDATIIGQNCTLRNNCTIGIKVDSRGNKSNAPTLGNNVNLGAHVIIIGPVNIGDNVIIGAGAVVVKDVPSNSVAAGNPARVLRKL